MVVADGLELRMVRPDELHEQPVNAQEQTPEEFAQLVENIRARGAMESIPYCSQPDGSGPVAIVSGHHRVRAARVVGLAQFPVLVDTKLATRSEVVAKQIAHNALTGRSDEAVLRRMLGEVKPVDIQTTGLDKSFLAALDKETPMGTPEPPVEWKVVSLVFLPNQMQDFVGLIAALEGHQEIVAAAPIESYQAFSEAMGACARVTETRSVGTLVATLTEMALAEVEASTDPEASENA